MSDPQATNETSNRGEPTRDQPLAGQVLDDTAINRQTETESRKRLRWRKLRKAPIWIEAFAAIALVGITAFYTYYAHQQAKYCASHSQ
jgi:hypothetical protein